MEIKVISYLILLLDTLKRDVDMSNLESLWHSLSIQERFDEDMAETLLYLWHNAYKSGTVHRRLDSNHISNEPTQISSAQLPQFMKNEMNPQSEKIESFNDTVTEKTAVSSNGPKLENQVSTQMNSKLTGRYIYGIVSGRKKNLDIEGIEEAKVYLIWHRNIGAMVHQCLPEPYQSDDRDQVENWLKNHQEVLDKATGEFNSIIPMSFDIIIDGSKDENPDQTVRLWLEERYDAIARLMEKLSHKVEYGIKAYCTAETLLKKAKAKNPAIDELSQKIANMSKGAAYLFRSELANLVRTTTEEIRNSLAQEIESRLKFVTIEIKEELKGKLEGPDTDLIFSLSVLADPDQVNAIGDILEDCQNKLEITIHFTGPWPPYSFVTDID